MRDSYSMTDETETLMTVGKDRIAEFEDQGWRIVSHLSESHHGDHAVLMRYEAGGSACT